MQKKRCANGCGRHYWAKNHDDIRPCPVCTGIEPCSECGKAIEIKGRKTCSHECSEKREARLAKKRQRKPPLKSIRCPFCRDMFTPRRRDQEVCSRPSCQRTRERLNKQRAYHGEPGTVSKTQPTRGPWGWLSVAHERDRTEYAGRRNLLTTLADQTADGTFPYPDPLAVRECVSDSCPFL